MASGHYLPILYHKSGEIWTCAMLLLKTAWGRSTNSEGTPWEKLQNLAQLVVLMIEQTMVKQTHTSSIWGQSRLLKPATHLTHKSLHTMQGMRIAWFDVLYNRSMYKQIEGRAQAHEGAAGKTVIDYPQNPWLTLTLGSKTRAHAGAGDRHAVTLNLDRKFPNHNQYDMTSTSSTTTSANISGTSSPPHKWTVQEICNLVQIKFRKCPCWYQVKVCQKNQICLTRL